MKPLKEISSIFRHVFGHESKRQRLETLYESEIRQLLIVKAFLKMDEAIDFIEKVDFISHNIFGGGYTKAALYGIINSYNRDEIRIECLKGIFEFWVHVFKGSPKESNNPEVLLKAISSSYNDLKQRIEDNEPT